MFIIQNIQIEFKINYKKINNPVNKWTNALVENSLRNMYR